MDHVDPDNPTEELEQLLAETQPRVFAFLRARLGCEEMAADLMQETFLRVLRLPAYDHVRNVSSYLLRIAERLIIDHHRRAAPPTVEWQTLDEQACPSPTPEAAAEQDQLLELLFSAIHALPVRHRHVFVLHVLDGLSYTEIALRLGLSKRTVQRYMDKSIVHCRRRLLGTTPPQG